MLKRCEKVCRLSLHAGSPENVCTLAGLNLCHVRSLTALEYPVELPCLQHWEMRFLRVVDFEGCKKLEGHHLANMGNLFQLKYLSVRDSGVSELPEQIGKQQHLETLNLERTQVRELPQSIAQLHRLVHVVIDTHVKLPDEIGSMVALQELEWVNVFKQTIQFTQEIGKMMDLRGVSLFLGYRDLVECAGGGSCYKEYMDNILSSLAKLPYLHSLCIDIVRGDADGHFSLDSGASVPHGIRTFIIDEDAFIPRVPNWMCSLVNLQRAILRVMEFEVEDILVLGHLPALVLLHLTAHESFRPGSVAVSGNHGFRCLRRFNFVCAVPVMFQEGAMPKLEELTLMFSRENTQVQAGDGDFLFGVRHLPSLSSVRCVIHYNCDVMMAEIDAWDAKFSEMQAQIDEMSCEAAMVKLAEMEAASTTDDSVLPLMREVKVHPNAPKLELSETIIWNVPGRPGRVATTRRTQQETEMEFGSMQEDDDMEGKSFISIFMVKLRKGKLKVAFLLLYLVERLTVHISRLMDR